MTQPPPPPPYGQQPYGAPYGAPQPAPGGSNRTLWIIVAVIIGAVVLCCLGILGGIVWTGKQVKDTIDEAVEGTTPHAVTEGEEFAQEDYTAEPGWRVGRDSLGDFTISGLRVTNNGRTDTPHWDFTISRDGTRLGEVTCSSSVLGPDETAAMTCTSADRFRRDYDTVEVANSW